MGPYEVWSLHGNCFLQQSNQRLRSRDAVLWIDRANGSDKKENKAIVYCEGDVLLDGVNAAGPSRPADQTWLARFTTIRAVQPAVRQISGEPNVLPPIYQRGMDRRRTITPDTLMRTEVRTAQFTEPTGPLVPIGSAPFNNDPTGPTGLPGPSGLRAPAVPPLAAPPLAPPLAAAPGLIPSAGLPPALAGCRIRVFPRGEMGFQAQSMPDPSDARGGRRVVTISSGVNVIVDGLNANLRDIGTVNSFELSADRVVIWLVAPESANLTGREGVTQDANAPLEFYLEGNVEFREGDRVIHADRMYYDVPNHVGTILNSEILTPFQGYNGKIRVKSDVLQQTGEGQYFAHNAFVTSSRIGSPSYRLQSGDIYFEDLQKPAIDPLTGLPLADPVTNAPLLRHERQATASNNLLYLGPAPVFYYPYFASDLTEPTFYIRRARAKYDNVYGAQILTNWNGYELLGIKNRPEGTDLDVSFDYLGLRGWGGGTTFTYARNDFFGIPGQTGGMFDIWGIHDNGVDNLGVDRSALVPEKTNRFRLFGQHREMLGDGYQVSAEAGWISDRNFLQSFFEQEWDELKDQSTDVELKHISENMSWSLMAGVRLDNFFTQTEWLPRADHYWLGESLFNDTFTWYEHTNVAFARFKPANPPANPNDQPYAWLPWEVNPPFATSQSPAMAVGQRIATRQEIDYPFQLGAVKIVPYALGEAANWGQDLEGNGLTRLYGQGGVRATLPLWSVDPTIQDDLFNLHGIMHKVNFVAEYAYSQSNQDVELLPLYDPLDDDSIEVTRRRNRVYDYNSPPSPFPPQYDERLYAIRSGLGSNVSSPSTEVLGDLSVFRLGVEQRWQDQARRTGQRAHPRLDHLRHPASTYIRTPIATTSAPCRAWPITISAGTSAIS